MSKKKGAALRELHWKTLVLGSHYPEEFDAGKFQSTPGDSFPIDIVLGLDKLCNVYKVVLEVDDDFIPSRVDIRIGKGDINAQVNYKNARLAKFQKPVRMDFYKRERSMSRMESKNAFTDSVGQYIWLSIEKPIEHVVNPNSVIAIRKLSVFGYLIPVEDVEKMKSAKKELEDPEIKQESESEPQQIVEYPRKEITVNRHSYEGDGMNVSGESALGSDPLTSLRTIRNVLEEKMSRSNEEGKIIHATSCLRAIQRIDEYEARIEDLATRRSRALQAGNSEMAERHRLAMIDCRDTVFRAVHIDLLLQRDELRAIGVQSDWCD